MSNSSYGTLFIVSTPIGNLQEASKRVIDTLNMVDIVACEDTRNTRKLLSHFDIHKPMLSYHNFNEDEESTKLISLLKEGKNIALVSDAGYPLISDPGYILVNRLSAEDINMTVISGPNAGINALVASGLETSHYLFYGFLNAKASKAKAELLSLKEFPYTLIFYEAPHRINRMLNLLYEVYGNRKACVARELTKIHEEYVRGYLEDIKDREYKGEIVVVLEGFKGEDKQIDVDLCIDEVKKLINNGLKTKEAVKVVSEKYKIKKNDLYNSYIKEN